MSVVEENQTPEFLRAAVVEGSIMLPNEPNRFLPTELERLFIWAVEKGASDITIQSDRPIFLEIYGRKYWVTRRSLSNSEVLNLVTEMFRSESARADLSGPKALDFAYELRPDRVSRYRFRINATAVKDGIQITARHITSMPPKLLDLGIEADILAAMAPKQGMVVVTGGTGSGKSTLLAGIIRYLAENPHANLKILTYEQPIEYVYDEVVAPSTSIAQTEIGRNLPTFEEGTRNALRRKPDIILVGEARDKETIGEAITASMTGHLLYTTIHSNGFADTIRRMVNVFPDGEKNARAVDIVSALRLVISQRLVPSPDGKRVALREYVVFNEEIVDQILDGGLVNLTTSCRKVLRQYGRSFLQDAEDKFRQGRIDEKVLAEIRRGARGESRDAQQEQEALLDRLQQAGRKAESLERAIAEERAVEEHIEVEVVDGAHASAPPARPPAGVISLDDIHLGNPLKPSLGSPGLPSDTDEGAHS